MNDENIMNNNSLPINGLIILSHLNVYNFKLTSVLLVNDKQKQNEIIMIINIQVKVSNFQVHFQI